MPIRGQGVRSFKQCACLYTSVIHVAYCMHHCVCVFLHVCVCICTLQSYTWRFVQIAWPTHNPMAELVLLQPAKGSGGNHRQLNVHATTPTTTSTAGMHAFDFAVLRLLAQSAAQMPSPSGKPHVQCEQVRHSPQQAKPILCFGNSAGCRCMGVNTLPSTPQEAKATAASKVYWHSLTLHAWES